MQSKLTPVYIHIMEYFLELWGAKLKAYTHDWPMGQSSSSKEDWQAQCSQGLKFCFKCDMLEIFCLSTLRGMAKHYIFRCLRSNTTD